MRKHAMMNEYFYQLMAVFAICIFVSTATAQEGRSLESHLALLDQELKFTQQLVSVDNNPQLLSMLREARELRTSATGALARGEKLMALNHLRAAHRIVDQVTQTSVRNPLERMRNQLNALMQRGEQAVTGSGNIEAERLLEEARAQKKKAADAVLQRRFQSGLEHYRLAVYLVQRAIELVEGPTKSLSDRVADARQQYQELLNTARDMVARSSDPIAKRVMGQAVQQALGTRAALNRGNMALALDLYYRSTRLLLRAINIAEGHNDSIEAQAGEELAHINELIEYAGSQMQGGEDATSAVLLERARDFQRLARDNFNSGHYQRTIQHTEAAEGIIRRVMRRQSAPAGDVVARVQQELDRLQVDLDAAAEAWPTEKKREIQMLWDEADNLAHNAEAALSRGENRYALELILAAKGLLITGAGLGKADAETKVEVAELDKVLQQLDTLLGEADKRVTEGSGDAYLLLEQCRILRAAALEALTEENHTLANALAQIALDFCQKATSIKR